MTGNVGAVPIAVLASLIRTDEQRLLGALEHRGVRCEQVDCRTLWSLAGGQGWHWRGVLNREIGQVRAAYAARTLEAADVPVLNSAVATEVCGDKWRTTLALASAARRRSAG